MGDLSETKLIPQKEAVPGSCSLTVDEACRIVRSGDIILFSGQSWTSLAVTLFCASQWSHIGIVYRPPGEEPLLFESIKTDDDGSPNIDVRTNQHRVGVRLVNLRMLLNTFIGHAIAIRTLMTPTSLNAFDEFDQHMTRTIFNCIEDYGYLPYEERWINFFLARYDFIRLSCSKFDSLFCSELVALCYQKAGLFSGSRSSLQYLPDDFSQVGHVRLSYPLDAAAAIGMLTPTIILSPELFIQLPSKKQIKQVYSSQRGRPGLC
ncbi:MAG: hypothetical protein ACOVQN_02510 [Exiguobacterium sp.]